MKLTSADFRDGELLNPQFTCDGQGVSPHLGWSDVPSGTQSFALRCFDPDAPGVGFVHWLAANIPAAERQIPRGGRLPATAVEVENDFGKTAYGGPCPPSGVHRYEFTLYALDAPRLDGLTSGNFLDFVKQHTITATTLMCRYQRKH